MLSTLTNAQLAAADSGVFASHRGGDHEGGFFFLLLLLALIGAGIFFWRRRRGDTNVDPTPPPAPPAPTGTDARALLDERFAKGEIDQAEYEHRRAVLAGESATPPVSAPPTAPEAPAGEPEADENQ